MPVRALFPACAFALILALPGVAAGQVAQTPTVPQDGSGLTDSPPGLGDDAPSGGGQDGSGSGSGGGGEDGSGSGSGGNGGGGEDGSGSGSGGNGGSGSEDDGGGARDRAEARELPDTGADPRLLLLTGLSLTLVGAGLRLRTADADLY